MAVTANFIGKELCRLTVDGEAYLGVRVSSHTKAIAGQLRGSLLGNGWIVTGSHVEPWMLGGMIEHEGAIYAYGPLREGKPLPERLSGDAASSVRLLSSFAVAAAALKREEIELSRFLPDSILVDSNGGFLFLPRVILDNIRNAQTEEQRVEAFEPFNHPDLDGERNLCFFIGILMYHVLAERYPFTAVTSEEVHQRMREQEVLPPYLYEPAARPEVCDAVVRSLDPKSPFTLEEWIALLDGWKIEGLMRQIDAEERSRILAAADQRRRKIDGSYRRGVFFQRNWRTMAIIAGIVIVVAAIGGSILKNVLKPRVTVGMTPDQVVSLFYNSVTTLDSQSMQDCVIGGAGKDMIREATSLFVITRVRQGYEHTTGYVPAQAWIDKGRPKLPPPTSVYGVADLKIQKSAADEFTVSYQKWEPYQSPDADQAPAENAPIKMMVQGFNRIDKVHLTNEGKYWAIDRIDRIENDPVSPPLDVTGAAAPKGQPAPVGAP